jgi:serine/threonine protein kinase
VETELHSRMRHPNIVEMYGCHCNKPPYFIVMQYLPRGSLHEMLHDSRIPQFEWSVIRQFSIDIAKGFFFWIFLIYFNLN